MLSTEKDMIRHIFDFSDVKVDQIMVPLSMMAALPVTATIREAVILVAEKKCLRLPVYQDHILNIIGILHYFDLLEPCIGHQTIPPVIRIPSGRC